MHHLFVLNKSSLGRKFKSCTNDIKKICINNSLSYEIIATKSIIELNDKLRRYNTNSNAVYYAVGGDGTFQSLVNAVDLKKCVLQYLPYGSGNNAYITFYNKPFDLKKDILSSSTKKADLGQANGEYFVTMFGLALDAHGGKNLAKFRWLPSGGKAKYFASIIYTMLFDLKPVVVKMTIDGAENENISSFISITNGPTTGGNSPISPQSSAFDGKLNALISDELTLLQALELFSKVKTGEHLNNPHLIQYLFEHIVFKSHDELMYEIDGEIRYAKNIDVKVCKQAITLKG